MERWPSDHLRPRRLRGSTLVARHRHEARLEKLALPAKLLVLSGEAAVRRPVVVELFSPSKPIIEDGPNRRLNIVEEVLRVFVDLVIEVVGELEQYVLNRWRTPG